MTSIHRLSAGSVPEDRPPALLGPLKASYDVRSALTLDPGAVARARQMIDRSRAALAALPDTLATDHPLTAAIGQARAQDMIDRLKCKPVGAARELAARRAKVLEMSLAGRRVREIAAAIGRCAGTVVTIRRQLREAGELRPLPTKRAPAKIR